MKEGKKDDVMPELYFRHQTLKPIARKRLSEHDEFCLNSNPAPVPLETIIEQMSGIRVEYLCLINNGRKQGRMTCDDGYTTFYDRTIGEIGDYSLMEVKAGTMMIGAFLLEKRSCYIRLRFTMAHEPAHCILHTRIFCGTGVAADLYKSDTAKDSATEWHGNHLG